MANIIIKKTINNVTIFSFRTYFNSMISTESDVTITNLLFLFAGINRLTLLPKVPLYFSFPLFHRPSLLCFSTLCIRVLITNINILLLLTKVNRKKQLFQKNLKKVALYIIYIFFISSDKSTLSFQAPHR